MDRRTKNFLKSTGLLSFLGIYLLGFGLILPITAEKYKNSLDKEQEHRAVIENVQEYFLEEFPNSDLVIKDFSLMKIKDNKFVGFIKIEKSGNLYIYEVRGEDIYLYRAE